MYQVLVYRPKTVKTLITTGPRERLEATLLRLTTYEGFASERLRARAGSITGRSQPAPVDTGYRIEPLDSSYGLYKEELKSVVEVVGRYESRDKAEFVASTVPGSWAA